MKRQKGYSQTTNLSFIIFFLCSFICKLSAAEFFVQPVVFCQDNIAYIEISYVLKPSSSSFVIANAKKYFQLSVFLRSKMGISKAEKFQISCEDPKSGTIHLMRWVVDTGDYVLESHLLESGDSLNELFLKNDIQVRPCDKIALSQIQLLSKVSNLDKCTLPNCKNGFYFEPLLQHTLYKNQYKLISYVESYQAPNSIKEKLMYRYSVDKIDSIGTRTNTLEWYKKRPWQTRDIQLSEQDISSLASGEYYLKVELMNAEKKVIDQTEQLFSRINPFWDRFYATDGDQSEEKLFFQNMKPDSVIYAVKAMKPILSSGEIGALDYLTKLNKIKELKIFLYQSWKERSETRPVESFQSYMSLARAVDKKYNGGFGYGFETDRGFIILRYGNPTEIISEEYENGAYPYEIWKYSKLGTTGQTRVTFLFYNPDLAGSDYRLLHCNAIGERFNPLWENELYKNAREEFRENDPLAPANISDNFNRRAKDYFKY